MQGQDTVGIETTARYARTATRPDTSADEARERIGRALGIEGFAIIAEIDMAHEFRRRLDREIGSYYLLDASHPKLTELALAVSATAGLLVICRVAVWQEGADAVVSLLSPRRLIEALGPEKLFPLAWEAEERLERALVQFETLD